MLRNRSLTGLLTAELVSFTGSAMTFVALPWFVLATTGSTAKMGWVLAAELAPIGLLGIPNDLYQSIHFPIQLRIIFLL